MITVSAPGSVMVTGEHAVVYGHPAIVCAVEQRVTIRFEPRADRHIEIHSTIAPPQTLALEGLAPEGPYRFVLASLSAFQAQLSEGLTLTITSQIDPTLGLGSSAAVTAAMLYGVNEITGAGHTRAELHRIGVSLIRQLQGRGSGADLAASLFGGVLSYQIPDHIEPLPNLPVMSLRYAGYKTPTGEVLAKIAADMDGHEAQYEALYARMGQSAERCIQAVRAGNWSAFEAEINAYQTLMAELGVSDDTLDDMIKDARHHVGAAKISGSGLGDCILAFGPKPDTHISAKIAAYGARVEREFQ